jgi:hypothetical protein
MAKLIYIANVSLDGFIEDAGGSFDWTAPDEEVFASSYPLPGQATDRPTGPAQGSRFQGISEGLHGSTDNRSDLVPPPAERRAPRVRTSGE